MLFIFAFLFLVFAATYCFLSFYIVPQRMIFIVERFGKYHRTLHAGFNTIIPFIDEVAYRHSLKETAVDTPMQVCITKDNIAVEVDGILYLKVSDPQKASYGIQDYLFATTQLAQTTMRSIIGKLDLDQTFEEREKINVQIVDVVNYAADPWGITLTRYEIKDIKPPKSIYDAMEKQMRAEREKRAIIAQSEGEKQARINRAEGEKQEMIAISEGEKLKKMNEAEGKAKEILMIAEATAAAIKMVALQIQDDAGEEAMRLKLAEQYLQQLGLFAKNTTTMFIPSDMTDGSKVLGASLAFSHFSKDLNVK